MVRKEIRQKQILNIILEEGRILPSREIAERLGGVTDRTIRRDLEEIADQIAPMVLEDIPRELFLTIRKKIPMMKEHNLIALMGYFVSKKTETKVEADIVTVVKPSIDWESLDGDERRKLIEAGRVLIKQRRRTSEDEPASIH